MLVGQNRVMSASRSPSSASETIPATRLTYTGP
jgi:hypothetical protein